MQCLIRTYLSLSGFTRDRCSFTSRKLNVDLRDTFCVVEIMLIDYFDRAFCLLSSMFRFYLPCTLCYVLAPHDSNKDLKSHTRKFVDCFACCIMPLYGSEPKETTQAKHVVNHRARACSALQKQVRSKKTETPNLI